jgi:hypothetical protein
MFRKNWIYILILLCVLFALVGVARKGAKRDVRWENDYTAGRKMPYACKLTHEFLDDMLDGDLEDVRQTAYQQLSQKTWEKRNYVFINSQFNPSPEDVHELMRFVREGNTVLVAAQYIGGELVDSLDIEITDPFYLDYKHALHRDSSFQGALVNQTDFVEANFLNPALHYRSNYHFDRTRYAGVFNKIDTANTTALGTDKHDYINYIEVKRGKGTFLIHTLPEAYTNYYASSRITSPYLFRALSYLPQQETFWDEHYKDGLLFDVNTDRRRYIMGEPALKRAYQLIVALGFLLLLFGIKRRQRAVPVEKPLENSTLEFVETVGALYYRQENHNDIMRKKINYFLESIRSRFQVQTDVFDESFVRRISRLSGVPDFDVQQLFVFIGMLRSSGNMDEQNLKKLEQQIWEFNQKSKR